MKRRSSDLRASDKLNREVTRLGMKITSNNFSKPSAGRCSETAPLSGDTVLVFQALVEGLRVLLGGMNADR